MFRIILSSKMQRPLSKLFCDASKSNLEFFAPTSEGSQSYAASSIEALEPKKAVMYLQNILTPSPQVPVPKYFAQSLFSVKVLHEVAYSFGFDKIEERFLNSFNLTDFDKKDEKFSYLRLFLPIYEIYQGYMNSGHPQV